MRMVRNVTAPANDNVEECPDIIQKRVRHPSFYVACPITVMAGSFLELTTGTAWPTDPDFHRNHSLQALAVVSPGVIQTEDNSSCLSANFVNRCWQGKKRQTARAVTDAPVPPWEWRKVAHAGHHRPITYRGTEQGQDPLTVLSHFLLPRSPLCP